MAGLIPITEISASGDITTGANISRPNSRSRRAVENLIRDLAPSLMSEDPDVQAAAIAAVSTAVQDMNLMEASRGLVADGTDLNDLSGVEHSGPWQLNSSFTYGNSVEIPEGAVLLVWANSAVSSTSQLVVTEQEFWWREAVNTSTGVWGPWNRVGHADDIPLAHATREILELARADGWLAVYDPGNPRTRSMIRGNIRSVSDALGNLPPAKAGNAASAPALDRGYFGDLDAMRFGDDGVAKALRTGAFDTPQDQPTFLLTVAQLRPGATTSPSRMLIDGQQSGARNAIFAGALGNGSAEGFGFYAGYERVTRDIGVDNDIHVFGAQYAGGASRFFIDGAPQFLVGGGGSDFSNPMGGLTIGNRFQTAANRHWDGWIGPVLVYPGIPTDEVRERMSRLLLAYSQPDNYTSTSIVSESAVYCEADGSAIFSKEKDTLKIPASITKVLSGYVAREVIDDSKLDDLVTCAASDNLTGSSPALRDGDQISYRDLLYLMMLPSHNVAARIMARAVGDQLPGPGDGSEKFIARMNALAASWDWNGAVFNDSSGLSSGNRMSAQHAADLMLRCYREDPTLTSIMGTLTRDVSVLGPDARTISAVHTIRPDAAPRLPEFVAGKTGTLSGVGNVAMLVREGSGPVRALVTMRVTPASMRYQDARRILDGLAEISRPPGSVEADIAMGRVLDDPASTSRAAMDRLYAPDRHVLEPVDISAAFPEIEFASGGSSVTLQRAGNVVMMTLAAVRFPASYSLGSVIPDGYTPATHSYALSQDRSTGQICNVQISGAGAFSIANNEETDVIRTSLTWVTTDPLPVDQD